MSRVRFNRLTGPLLLLAVTAACGGSGDGKSSVEVTPAPVTPKVLSFAATPEQITAGGSATLKWRTQDAVSIVLTDGQGTEIPLAGADVADGSVEVSPTETTAYTLTATGAAGAPGPVWRTATVSVAAPGVDAPTIEEFTATPGRVGAGGDVVLSWRTTNASRLTIKDDVGVEIDLGGAAVDQGQVTVRPIRPATSYVLAATGAGGRANATVAVEVTGLPRVARFYVDPIAPVAPGSAVTLYWETQNTSHVVIRQSGAIIVDTTTELSGSQRIELTDNATFDLEATGPGGTATAQTLAQVGASIVSFTASQRIVRAGDPVDFAWQLEGADRAVIDGPGSYHLALTGPALQAGTATVNVTQGGDFVLQVFRGEVARTAAIAVDVTLAPRVRAVAVDQPIVTAAALFPATVTLSWTQDGADTCTILRNNEPVPGFTGFACGHTGTAEVQVFGTSTFKLVAVNTAGTHAGTVDVQGIAPATIVAFASQPARRLTPGSLVELSWNVTDAVSISMEKNGANLPVGPTDFVAAQSDRVDFDSVYTLTALNSLGHATMAQVTVRAGAPVVLAAAADPSFAGIGDALTLSWVSDGGDTLTVTDSTGTQVFTTTDPAAIDAGSVQVLAPLTAGTYPYTVTSSNSRGDADTATIEVVVSDGPMIKAFAASKPSISLTESLTLSWNVTNDPSGATPTLTLVDNYGHTFDVSGKNANNGSFTFTPEEEGAHVYTLTAKTAPGRTVATATAPVEITVRPIAVSFTAAPNPASTQDGTVVPQVVLSWQSQNGVDVSIWESDAAGNVIPPALHRVALATGDAQAALDAGSFTVGPTASTYYVLRVKNRVGSFVDTKLKVVVDPPKVLTFRAEPAEIVEGESVQFSWTTSNATGVRLDPLPAIVSRLGNTYVDVSANGGTKSSLVGDDVLGQVDFPAGFVFPFAGVNRTAIQLSTNGWAGFNIGGTSSVATPGALPNDSYRYVNFAVFTGDLNSTKNTPNGEIWYGMLTDAKGDYFAIQWKHWGWHVTTYIPADLNFELILRPNGDFEYRYGTMSVPPDQTHANGVGSSLGFQFPAAGSPGMNVVPNSTAVPGGLSDSGFAFQLTYPVNGSISATPATSGTYTVTAFNADASASKDASVTVWKVPAITSARATPTGPETTKPFKIEWTATNATRVRVLDASGTERCRETDPARVPAGSCTLTETTPGVKTYTVEAINGLERNVVTKTVGATVYPLLSLDSFAVAPSNFVSPGTPVTLTWSSTGAIEMQLFACVPLTNHGTCTDITPSGANPSSGSTTYTMTKSVDFWVRVYDVQYRAREASKGVWVDAPTLNGFTASSTQIAAGGSTTLNWNTTGTKAVTLSGQAIQNPVSVTATAPFIDLTASDNHAVRAGGTADGGYFDVTFPDGFVFPWFGLPRTALRVSTDGWLTFDTGYTTTHYTEYTMPTTSYPAVQIAPFWDDLKQGANDILWRLDQTAGGVKYVVIEWKGWAFSSSTYNPSNLNFEVVLFENGDVDFRYGTMTAPTAYASYAAGDSAAMGWQSPDAKVGKMLTTAAGDVVSGGLANKSWRFPFAIDPNSSTVVSPSETTTYQLCVTNSSLYIDCKQVKIVVVKPGDMLISELMIAPASDDAEWFEVRNTAVDPIDLAGFTVTSGGTESFSIPTTPAIVIPPGGFAVLARSATASGGLTPNVVYGNALTLADSADEVRLSLNGTAIDGVAWSGTGWGIVPGRSIALEPSVMARSNGVNDFPFNWCATTATYGNGTFGGSPGALGAGCLTADANQWYVVDPVSGMPFIDISKSGTDDSSILAATYYANGIALGFTMPYFGSTATEMSLSKHGYLALAPQTTFYSSNGTIPDSGKPNGLVAPFWDSVATTAGSSFLHHQQVTVGSQKVMISQWTNVSGGAMTYGTLDFQVQLWENGDIVFAYRNVNKLTNDQVYGSSATIGIEDGAGTSAIQLFSGSTTTGGGPIYSGRSFLFHHR